VSPLTLQTSLVYYRLIRGLGMFNNKWWS